MNRKTLQAGVDTYCGMGLTLFSEDELYSLHCATLDVMYNVGIKVTDREARDVFAGGGAIIEEDKELVRIPAFMVEDAIRSAPGAFLMAAPDPKNDYYINNRSVGFTNFGEGVRYIDPYSTKPKNSTKQALRDITRLSDAMENVTVYWRALGANDVPVQVQSIHNGEAIFNNTTKHLIMGANCGYNFSQLVKMASAVVGGLDNLRKRPIYTPTCCPNSPLTLNPDMTEVVMGSAKLGLPALVISMALAGGTTPVTLAGTLVCHNAEVLSGLVLSQLTKRGVPFVYGSSTTIMDMRFTTAAVGAPELGMLNAGVAKLAQYYNLPSLVAGG